MSFDRVPAVLAEIARDTQARMEDAKLRVPQAELERRAFAAPKPASFLEAFPAGRVNVVAEIKRASPSEGDIAPDANPGLVAREYLRAGAAALSVLTEPKHFRGDVAFLERIRAREAGAKLLMKDFILDEYQLLQARAFGANAALLIVAMLSTAALKRLFAIAYDLSIEALVEVHDEAELERATAVGARLIGVNNRDLKTMKVSLKTSELLAERAPKNAVLVAESGLTRPEELRSLSQLGFRGFLIGTSFMRTGRPGEALRALLERAGAP